MSDGFLVRHLLSPVVKRRLSGVGERWRRLCRRLALGRAFLCVFLLREVTALARLYRELLLVHLSKKQPKNCVSSNRSNRWPTLGPYCHSIPNQVVALILYQVLPVSSLYWYAGKEGTLLSYMGK